MFFWGTARQQDRNAAVDGKAARQQNRKVAYSMAARQHDRQASQQIAKVFTQSSSVFCAAVDNEFGKSTSYCNIMDSLASTQTFCVLTFILRVSGISTLES